MKHKQNQSLRGKTSLIIWIPFCRQAEIYLNDLFHSSFIHYRPFNWDLVYLSVVDCFVFCWVCCYCFWVSFLFTSPYRISDSNFIIIIHLFIYICHQNAWQSCKFEFTAMTSVIKCILQWVGNRRLSSTH